MERDDRTGPGISIVTVALNAARMLPLTLESMIAQDYPDREIIVVDGGSWDGTTEVLRRYAPVLDHVVVAEDAGIYHAMNDALGYVTKDYVLFMNAGDQFYCAEAISTMVRALEDDPDIFYGNHIYVDGGRELFKRAAPFEWIADNLAAGRIDGTWLDRIPCHQATFVRTALLRQLGFDTRLRISADHDLLFRAHAAGARTQYVDEIVCHYFGGGFSALAGERTRLEGASIYRQYTDRVDLLDRHFFPAGTRLATQTRRTGVKLGGFLATEGWAATVDASRGGNWIAAAGGELLVGERTTRGLEIAGYNELEGQSASVWLGEERIAQSAVPRGYFRLELSFGRTVPPASMVRLCPNQVQLLGDRQQAEVGFAVHWFRFADSEGGFRPGIAPGEHVQFRSAALDDVQPLLGGGWSATEATHTWSLGKQAELWLKLEASASGFDLVVSGNPHVPDGRQQVELRINDVSVAAVTVDNGSRGTIEFDCTNPAWRRGTINHLVLVPSAYAVPPADTGDKRPLGFCLWKLDVR